MDIETTEDNLPIRTVYIPDIPIFVSKQCERRNNVEP